MAVQSITIEAFLEFAEDHPVLDVRSPSEYEHAHIPGAFSLPLFNDAERAKIGTAYKQASREQAIKIGLDAFGPKMRAMVEEAEKLTLQNTSPDRILLVHCWRGGMRSTAVAWLLDLYGFTVYLLEGGYKAYRNWVIRHWQNTGRVRVLAGFTGAGKTKVLHSLQALGEPVLDLEALAAHKGSAFGGLDDIARPSQEMFENLLAGAIHNLRKRYPDRAFWIEDESQRIGNLNIPHELFRVWASDDVQMLFLQVPFEQRLHTIVAEYGSYATERLINAIVRIKKRLGPLQTKTAIAHFIEGDISACFAILLHYYDKHYLQRPATRNFKAAGMTPEQIAIAIQHYFND